MKRAISCIMLLAIMIFAVGCETVSFDEENMEIVQLNPPEDGQQIAIVTTTKGVIKAVLYPEYCPNTVENFVQLANEGFYNGQKVFAIEPSNAFMAGSDSDTGETAKTITGKDIKNEYHDNLWPLKGALCSIGSREGRGDSRYFFVNTVQIDPVLESEMEKNGYPKKAIEGFVKAGGAPSLARQYTVFGQAYEGLDVIEEITKVDIEDEKSKIPVEEIIIEKIEISTYESSGNDISSEEQTSNPDNRELSDEE